MKEVISSEGNKDIRKQDNQKNMMTKERGRVVQQRDIMLELTYEYNEGGR